jgi:CDP-diglyceride synthetase
MSDLRTLAYALLWAAGFCQFILLWMQVRAFARYRHKSFAVLAVGTMLGLTLAVVTLLEYFAPSILRSPKGLYAVALVCGIAQVPVGVWGVAWLFQSYGQLQSRAHGLLPTISLERAREG